MDEKLSKELDIIIENKIGDLWRGLSPETKTGVVAAGIVASIPLAITAIKRGVPALIKGVHAFFKLFREKCKRQCEKVKGGERQYNLCYYSCKRDITKQCIRNLEGAKSACKDDECRKKVDQEITIWKEKLNDIEQILKKI